MSTPRRFSLIFIKLTFFFSFLGFSTLNLVATYGPLTGLYLSALCWTVYVMCLPFFGGGILFYPLAPIVGYHPDYVWEAAAWIVSIGLHIFTLLTNPAIYEKTSVTHFIYWSIRHPYPYWIIFIAAALPTIATWLYKTHRIPARAFWYYQLRFALAIIALVLLFAIALKDIIILSNIHA
ncbi:MAG: hypothetical protein QG604_856 [Candidatus Dependentiae bacterium]|nr:hypothetical protein [Candidatus Dependentiae bacterium]